jgi:SNF2 family DNA or RNA helicase
VTFTGTLRPYQEEPVERMKERRMNLLGAEQGTGKTTMTIKAIEDQFDDERILEPGLIICIGTLMQQWADKIEEFTQGTSTSLIIPAGSDAPHERRLEYYQRAYDWDADYIILSYDAVVNDWHDVRKLPTGFLVMDEISLIRGFGAQRSKAVKKLSKKFDVRYGLTGTPIENGKPEEIYSILEAIDPEIFGRWDLFDRTFIDRNNSGWVKGYKNLPVFHERLAPALIRLRSTDPEVAPFMPKTVDGVKGTGKPILVKWDQAGWNLYERIASDLLQDLEAAAKWGANFDIAVNYGKAKANPSAADRAKGAIGQKLQALMMLCDHPELLRISSRRYIENSAKGRQGGSAYINALDMAGLLHDGLGTPKLDRLERWLQGRLDEDPVNKIVVFTRFVPMVTLIRERAVFVPSQPYNGTMSAKTKDIALKDFQTNPATRLLVSSDAGGFGLDIPQANWLINYDLPDGAGAADQRDTRIVRTSSEFDWVSRNWIFMDNSVEVRNHARLNQKREVAKAFIDKKGLNYKGGLDLNVRSLTKFLKESLADPPTFGMN